MDEFRFRPEASQSPRYRWPWFLMIAVVLAVILAVLWLSKEIRRIRERREFNPNAPGLSSL